MTLLIYGDRVSGNCLKVAWTADKLRIPYSWMQTDIIGAQTRTPEFLAMNPAGQAPVAVEAWVARVEAELGLSA